MSFEHDTPPADEPKKTENAPTLEAEQVGEHGEDYASLENLFLGEHLDTNFDAVKLQLDQLREYIQQYNKDHRLLADDPGMEIYVDEHIANIGNWFKEFSINGKHIDISDLLGPGLYEDKFNEIVDKVNGYKEMFMIGSELSDISGML